MAGRTWFLGLTLAISTGQAAAQTPAGPELPLNAYTTGDQRQPAVAVDSAGNFVVAWESYPLDGDYFGVAARRFDGEGTPRDSSEFQVNTVTIDRQGDPEIAAGDDGRFLVVWSGSRAAVWGAYAQGRLFDASGTPLTGEFVVSYTGWGYAPAAVRDSTGGFLVVWTQVGDVFARRLDAWGTPMSDEFILNAYTIGRQTSVSSSVAPLPDGGFVAAWESDGQDGHLRGVFARRFDGAGNPLGPEVQVNEHWTGSQFAPVVASDASGGFVVVWQTYTVPVGDASEVFARRFDAAGAAEGPEFQVNQSTLGTQERPDVAMDARGNAFVVWTGAVPAQETHDVFGRVLGRQGPIGDEFAVGTAIARARSKASVAADHAGNFIVAWTGNDVPGSFGVFARQFLGDDIFADDFESGSLAAWSTNVDDGGDLAASALAALSGASGLQAVIDDTVGLFVQDDSPRGERRYRTRFWLDPNGFDPGVAQGHLRTRVFVAFAEAPSRRVTAVVLRLRGGVYGVMARARLDDGRQVDTAFFDVTDAPHAVEIDLQPASGPEAENGRLELFIDGASRAELTALDNSEATVDFARLGALSVKSGASGALYWDEFESRRFSYIGP